jgi:hypothetical protein
MATSKSSRKSLSRKSKRSNTKDTYIYTNKNYDNYDTYDNEFSLISLIVNILIIYYLVNLEDASCNCITDWRHDYIKYVALFNIICNIFILLTIDIKFLSGILSVLNLINIYAFYTYIGDLNDTKCACAVVKQEKLNKFLNFWRYFLVIAPIIGFIIAIYFLSKIFSRKKT